MSYSVTFKPPKEAVEKYNIQPSFSAKTEWKLEILAYCLKPHEESTSIIISFLKSYLTCWYNDIVKTTKKDVYDEYVADNEITFYGYEFSRGASNVKDELIKNILEKLIILADVISTPDYFESQEKFYDKLNDINEELTYFEEESIDIVKHEIMNDLSEYELKDEDSSI